MPSTLVLTVGQHSLLGIQSLTSGFSFLFPPSCRPWSISGGGRKNLGEGVWGCGDGRQGREAESAE